MRTNPQDTSEQNRVPDNSTVSTTKATDNLQSFAKTEPEQKETQHTTANYQAYQQKVAYMQSYMNNQAAAGNAGIVPNTQQQQQSHSTESMNNAGGKILRQMFFSKISYTSKGMPVRVMTRFYTENGEIPVDEPLFSESGAPYELYFDEHGSYIYTGMPYTQEGKPVTIKQSVNVYLPKQCFGTDGMPLYSEKPQDESLILYDAWKQPYFPISRENGYLLDKDGHHIYPEQGPTTHYFNADGTPKKVTALSGEERDVTTIRLFKKMQYGITPYYPYNEINEHVFEEDVQQIAGANPNTTFIMGQAGTYPNGQYPNQASQTNTYAQTMATNPYDQQNSSGYGATGNNGNGNGNGNGLPPYGNNAEKSNGEDDELLPEEPAVVWYKNPKLWGIIGGIVVVLILLIFLLFKLFGGSGDSSKFELKNDTHSYEYGEAAVLDFSDFFGKNMQEDDYDDITVKAKGQITYNDSTKTFTTPGKDTLAIGEYTVEFGYEKETVSAKIVVEDTKGPEIDGTSTVSFGVGDYSESSLLAKFKISDASKYTTEVDTGSQDLSKEGSYTVTITATDEYDNETTKKVNVKVAKTASQIAEEEAKEAEEKAKEEAEAKAKEEAEKAAEEAKKAAEEAAQKAACVDSVPQPSYSTYNEASLAGQLELTTKQQTDSNTYANYQVQVDSYTSNCGNPYYMYSLIPSGN
jgi:hypothetical protein